MKLVSKRLPATKETLQFISPFFRYEHVQKALDDRWKTYYGIFELFRGILAGEIRLYGVFDVDEPMRFLGFELVWLDESKEAIEVHSFWERDLPKRAADLAALCKDVMKEDYASDGIQVKYVVSYIPEENRAAKRMARQFGCQELGLRKDKVFYKGEYIFPCREYRMEL